MKGTREDQRLFLAVFGVLIALHAALMLSSRLLPFIDIPEHLAAATIARHIDEPGNRFDEYYRVETGLRPNTLHLVFCAVPVFPSAEAANRIFFALYASLLPLSVLLVIRRLGGNPWFSLLSFLLIYNYSVTWGFAGFAFAIPLVLLFCCFFVFDARGLGSPARAALGAALLVAIYFAHVLAALFALLIVLFALFPGGARSAKHLLGSVAASLPAVVMTALWWRGQSRGFAGPGLVPFLSEYYRDTFLPTLGQRWHVAVSDNFHLFDGTAGYAAALLFSIAIASPALILLLAKRKRPALRDASVVTLPLLLASVLCFLLLPNGIPQQWILYERFSVFILLALAIAAGALAPSRISRLGRSALVGLALLHFALWAHYTIAFNRENAGFDRAFLRPDAAERTLAGLIEDYTFRERPVYIHFPSYYIVWTKGIATANFTDYRFGAVRRKDGAPRLPRYLEWAGRLKAYDGRYAGMDYILLRGDAPDAADLSRFEAVRRAGPWTLLRARRRPIPFLPDAPYIPAVGTALRAKNN